MININKFDLNIGHLSTLYHTNFLLMNNEEFEKDLNRNINWVLYGTGPEMVQDFKKGKLDIGYMGLPPAIIAIDKRCPFTCVAGGHVEGTIMVAKKEYKNIENLDNNLYNVLHQFRKRSIGVTSKGSIHEVILSYYLKKYHLLDKIKVRNYEQAEFIAKDMKDNILDAGVGTPALAIFASTILETHLVVRAKDLWSNNPSYGIFFNNKMIQNESDMILKFLNHHKIASTLLRNSQLKAAEIIANNFRIIDKEYVNSVLKISPKYCISISKEFIETTMKFAKTLHKLNYINKKLKINEIFHFEFIKRVHPEPPHY